MIILGDATTELCRFAEEQSTLIDLCYLDPPFNVGVSFTARTQPTERRSRIRGGGPVAYQDSWGGIDGFLQFLEPVLRAIRDTMNKSAILWLHLDHRAIHDSKVLCDRVFGRGAFRGEVIWAPGNGARGKHGPSMTHQTLLIYTKDPRPKAEYVWNSDHPELREAYATTSLSMHFRNVDENGRKYRDRIINGKTYRYYADQGRRLGSVWSDIPAMIANTPIRAEGTGYPTQKPEKLLERIIMLSSRPKDMVCDPMCGSGTTLAVAKRLGRRYLGIDSSELAVELTKKRLGTLT